MKITFKTLLNPTELFRSMLSSLIDDSFNCSVVWNERRLQAWGDGISCVYWTQESTAVAVDPATATCPVEGNKFVTFTGSVYTQLSEGIWVYEGPQNGFLMQNLGPKWGEVEVIEFAGTFGTVKGSAKWDADGVHVGRWESFHASIGEVFAKPYAALRAATPRAAEVAALLEKGRHQEAADVLAASYATAVWVGKKQQRPRCWLYVRHRKTYHEPVGSVPTRYRERNRDRRSCPEKSRKG